MRSAASRPLVIARAPQITPGLGGAGETGRKRNVDTDLPPPCQPFQADGWCDTINNRAYCHYDGGDCCSSTLSSKKVSGGSGPGAGRGGGGRGAVPGMRALLGLTPLRGLCAPRLFSSFSGREEGSVVSKPGRF